MENLDMIILTTILSTLFVVFGILTYREFRGISKDSIWRPLITDIYALC